MGFLERSGQEVDSRVKQKSELEAAEKTLHEQRREQAASFRTESGIGVKVQTLAEILKKDGRLHYLSMTRPEVGVLIDGYDRATPLNLGAMDVDSVFDNVSFDTRNWITVTHWEGSSIVSDDYSDGKGITVETNPDGSIVFHGLKRVSISRQEWAENQKTLENTLKRTFNEPYIIEHKDVRMVSASAL